MMDIICEVIPKLKMFEYRASHTDHLKSIINKHSINLDYKFMELNSIGICFNGKMIPEVDIKANYLKDYLLAKCPRIDEILIEKDVVGWNWNYETDKWEATKENVVLQSENNDTFLYC